MECIVRYSLKNNTITKERYPIVYKEVRDGGVFSLHVEPTLFYDIQLNDRGIETISANHLRKSYIKTDVTDNKISKSIVIDCYEDGLNFEIENDKFVKSCFLNDINIDKKNTKYVYDEKMKALSKKEQEILSFFDKENERTVSECFQKEKEEKENEYEM